MYFCELSYTPRSNIHDRDTRCADLIDIESTRKVMAEKCIRIHLGKVINETPNVIMEKINTHSIYGFVFYIKRYYLESYWDNDNIVKIYVPHITFEYINFRVKSWELNDYVPLSPPSSSSSSSLSSSLSSPPDHHISVKLEHVHFQANKVGIKSILCAVSNRIVVAYSMVA